MKKADLTCISDLVCVLVMADKFYMKGKNGVIQPPPNKIVRLVYLELSPLMMLPMTSS
jgi:hypothetical protein